VNIEETIRGYIARTGIAPPADEDRLVERGFIPSIRLLELVGFLEDEFQITLRPVDLLPEKLATIAKLAAMVRERIAAQHVRK
jgi:acyl carrier protein